MKTWDVQYLRQQLMLLLHDAPELREDEQLRIDVVDSETDIIDFIKRLVNDIQDANALIDGTENRIKELEARKSRFELRVDKLKQIVHLLLQELDLKRPLQLSAATVYLQKGQPKLIGDFDVRNHPDLPEEYTWTTRGISKSAIVAALKAGKDIPNFHLSNPGTVLMMKVK